MKNSTSTILIASVLIGFIFISAQQPKPKAKVSLKAKAKIETKAPVPPKDQMVEISTVYGKMILRLYNETPLHRDNFIKLVQQGLYDSLLFHRVIKNFMIQGGDPQSKNAPADAMLGNGEVGYLIPAEFNPALFHKRGALAAARDDNPARSSSGCQFYIVQGKRYNLTELNTIRNSINYQTKTRILHDITNSDSVKNKADDFVLRGDKDGLHSYMLGLQPKIEEFYKKAELNYSQNQIHTYMSVGGAPHLDMNYTVFGELVEGFNVLDSIAAVKTGPNDRPVKDVIMQIKLLK